MSTKKIHALICSSLFFFCFATPASAAIDPRCMTLEDCKTMRKQIGVPDAELAEGFQTRADSREVARSCPEKMFGLDGSETDAGLCLPATAAETKIAIGGKTQFLSIAEYIAYIYRYSMIVAGALCVLLFIVAGFEWTLSGGDGSRIDTAKSRISNAVTGLILMATSYVVLYTIDPNLTSLKPPEVYLVRGVGAFDPWCSAIPTENMGLAVSRDLTDPNAEQTSVDANTDFSAARPGTAVCGFEYHIGQTGQVCKGAFCERGPQNEIETCGQKTSVSPPECLPGNIVGRIYSSNFFENSDGFFARHAKGTAGNFIGIDGIAEGWTWPWVSQATTQNSYDNTVAKALSLYIVCNDGRYSEIVDKFSASEIETVQPETEKSQFYYATASFADTSDATQNFCGGIPDRKGYVLLFDLNEFSDINDEAHFIGKDGTNGIDLGPYGFGSIETKCVFLGQSPQYFIQYEDLTQGIQINVNVADIYDIDNTEDLQEAYGETNNFTACVAEEQRRIQTRIQEAERIIESQPAQSGYFRHH